MDMLRRALATTEGTFSLRVASAVETGGHCAAVIDWTTVKDRRTIRDQDLAVCGSRDGFIPQALFFASDISNNQAF